MKKPGFNNIDNVVVKRIKDSVLSDGEILVSGGAFEGNIDPLVESRIETERAEIDLELAQLTNPNLLINGDFQIWQRGTSFTANTKDQYTADRWMMIGSLDTLNKVDKVSGGLKITTSSAYILYFKQILEFPNMLGKTVTMSCSVDGVPYRLTTVISTTNSFLTTPWGVFYTQYNTTNNLLSCSFAVNPSKTITINWVKLELGSVATPFHPKLGVEEFSNCQRYYLGGNWIFATPPYGLDNTNMFFIVPTPTTVRLKPTLIQGDIRIETQGVAQTGFAFEAYAVGVNALIVRASKANHGIPPGAYVYVVSTTAGYDAEIYY